MVIEKSRNKFLITSINPQYKSHVFLNLRGYLRLFRWFRTVSDIVSNLDLVLTSTNAFTIIRSVLHIERG